MIKVRLEELKFKIYKFIYGNKKDTVIKFEKTDFYRADLLKYIQDKIKINNKNFSYLEIGVQHETVFKEINTANKIGVDPISGGTHRMTSDEFFNQNEKFFDLIFIDGLHEYEQCKRDLLNSIKFLKQDGIIVFHDFIPQNYLECHVPRISRTWTGDVWKIGVQLTYSKNCDFFIGNFDHGIGILKLKNDFSLAKIENIKEINFSDFENKYYYEIPLRSKIDVLKNIDQYFNI